LKGKTMKITTIVLTIVLVASLISGCSVMSEVVDRVKDAETIRPSDNIITESRDVSSFDAIDFRTFGRVIISQGESESLTIEGSDNLVALIQTKVTADKLIIDTEKPISILSMDKEDVLTFTIMVKDLSELTVSGAGDVQMDALNTTSLDLVMSGAGNVTIEQFEAEELSATISGAGSLEVSGQVTEATIEISGAGGVKAGDLESQTATVNITGLGGVTVWVTEQLNGTISGAGSVSYYGDPQTNTNSTGLGNFEALGNK
jgi:hypothetical protein